MQKNEKNELLEYLSVGSSTFPITMFIIFAVGSVFLFSVWYQKVFFFLIFVAIAYHFVRSDRKARTTLEQHIESAEQKVGHDALLDDFQHSVPHCKDSLRLGEHFLYSRDGHIVLQYGDIARIEEEHEVDGPDHWVCIDPQGVKHKIYVIDILTKLKQLSALKEALLEKNADIEFHVRSV